MRVSQAIGRVLVDGGIEAFFGLAGSGNFAVMNALKAAGAAFYSSRHECGAVMMADGYARASRKVGVASVHQGPGFTNTLTGLTEAAKARTPLHRAGRRHSDRDALVELQSRSSRPGGDGRRDPRARAWARDRRRRHSQGAQARADRAPPRRPEHSDRRGRRALPRRPTGRPALATAGGAGSSGGFRRRGRGPARSLAPACDRRWAGRRPCKRARGARGPGR